jgi:dUTP pyrophosphatase
VRRLRHGEGLSLPHPQSAGSAGADLSAAVPAGEPLMLPAGAYARVPTGFVLEIPDGWEGQIRPRSGLAARHGVTVLNSPGTIDADYRGEIQVLLINHGTEPFTITRGDRVAQLVLARVALSFTEVEFREVQEVSTTDRGEGGFGSTGQS